VKLKPEDLFSLEQYSRTRKEFRAQAIAHKKIRTIPVGPHTTWCFEDRLTVQYQVQEMLRVERIFEPEGIQEELDAYNPLIPDGSNWKATLLIEFPDAEERRRELTLLKGIEDRCWARVAGFPKVYAIADEDMERENAEKTSAVHFLRFELSPDMASRARQGAAISLGIDHDHYMHALDPLPAAQQAALAQDLS
jgi:hypothetical protein